MKTKILQELKLTEINRGLSTGTQTFETTGSLLDSFSPIDGKKIASVKTATIEDYQMIISKAQNAFLEWREVPAPKRGEIVRLIGNRLREKKEALASLVTLEMGKIYSEGLGEVQEMIDICDFAVGQSRLLNGYTMRSERADHRIYDQYHPLGIVGLITSFNFPVAVWAWNAMIAAIAGNVVVLKPSSKTPLCAVAIYNIIQDVLVDNNVPEGVFNLIVAKSSVLGDNFVSDTRIPLFSVTGSTRVGKRIGEIVGQRLGKVILELGGNNAVIISKEADIDNAIKSVIFGSVGTCGQRCTSTRRVIIEESIYDKIKIRLEDAFKRIVERIGNPFNESTLVGSLIDNGSVKDFVNAIAKVKAEGGKVLTGGYIINDEHNTGNFVAPALVEAENYFEIVQEETFAPILYMMKYKTIEEAIALNNGVPQGLSSAIFTNNMIEAEKFLSERGSDCGIANVNLGTSGAEITAAFGGEKDTGGGRESGSDAWKTYMRRQSNTINFSGKLTLAQGIVFDV